MYRNLILVSLSFLLFSCFYYNRAEHQYFWGYLDGKRSDVDRYDLVYLFDGDSADVPNFFHFDQKLEKSENGHIKRFNNGFCNVFFRGSEMGCPNSLQGIVDVQVYLKNKKSGNSYLLAQKKVDMNAYRRAVMITQVYIGSDSAEYETRTEDNIEWNRANPLVLKADNDTIYHYTVKYWEKRETNDDYVYNDIDEKYFVEVP